MRLLVPRALLATEFTLALISLLAPLFDICSFSLVSEVYSVRFYMCGPSFNTTLWPSIFLTAVFSLLLLAIVMSSVAYSSITTFGYSIFKFKGILALPLNFMCTAGFIFCY